MMIATDLDGTLLGPGGVLSRENLDALTQLGERGVLRVIATGRSPYSAFKVLPEDLPIDYLCVSSGAGIIDYRTKRYVATHQLEAAQTALAVDCLKALELDFMVHDPLPHNHRFTYYVGAGCSDFTRRIDLYREHANVLESIPSGGSCQLIAIHPGHLDHHGEVQRQLAGLTVLRTTSPLDGESVWIEIFPSHVSKSQACAALCEIHGITPGVVLAIGNDTNDLDMLRWAGKAFVVDDAHPDLLAEFARVAGCGAHGFAEAAAQLLHPG